MSIFPSKLLGKHSAAFADAILLYVAWQLMMNTTSKSMLAQSWHMYGWRYMSELVQWRRRVLKSTMGNDTFILNGE